MKCKFYMNGVLPKYWDRLTYADEMVKTYLPEYYLKIRRMSNLWGSCNYSKKRITLAIRLLNSENNDLFDSILFHEIAHGLAYPNSGHCKREFKQYCKYFEARANRFISPSYSKEK